jgi:hypothetical protein
MSETTTLDQFVARLQNVRPFNIYTIDSTGNVSPWYEVTSEVVQLLVINTHDLATQVQGISAQIQFWGRMEAQCKRVWEIEERNYRRWRDGEVLRLSNPPVDPEQAKSWKKPSEKRIEALYRQMPQYNTFWSAVERAEEAFNGAHAILEGFRAKKDMLRSYVYRSQEDGAARLSV